MDYASWRAYARVGLYHKQADGESCVTLLRIGTDAWALGDSKRPGADPLRFTTSELEAAGIDPARFGLSV
ncbi:DUF397 domain-containing protein [Streptomyces sp. NPDC017979]|uniref:DUF397 domain-containing protein n=1 Tax=Streptomyces sp. NPDC017979 TaxID=3365024 RepID=UPI0037AA4854